MKPVLFITLPHFWQEQENVESLSDKFTVIVANTRQTALSEALHSKVPVEALIIGIREHINDDVLRVLPQLKVIGSLSTGIDHIDLKACEKRDILVIKADGSNAYSVAEHILMMMLALRKKLLIAYRLVLAGKDKAALAKRPGELRGSRIGIVGCGRSARHLISLLKPFAAQIAVWARNPDKHADLADQIRFLSLDELFADCDNVSINLALNEETKTLILPAHIRSMPEDAVLVNCSRLGLIDRPDLADAFLSRPDVHLGIDAAEIVTSHIFEAIKDRALLSPHIAGLTSSASRDMDRYVIAQVKHAFNIPD